MRDDELCAIIDRQLANTINADSRIESDQADANDAYHGRPYGNELEGRSSIVTRDVLEVIEWIKPSLMRIFGSDEQVVMFDPTGPEDEESAEQDTDVVRHVLMKDNDWFIFVYEWVHDALLQKVGYAKIYPEEVEKTETETLYGLTIAQASELLSQDGVEPVEHTSYLKDTDLGEIELHDIKLKLTTKSWCVKVDTVPSEEMKIPRSHTKVSVDDASFVAQEREIPASDLVDMGIDRKIVDQLHIDKSDQTELQYSRSTYETDEEDEQTDESMRPVTVQECYIRLDMDDDGVAELYRVLKSGEHILEKEECSTVPFVPMCAIPLPHEHVGMSEADLIMDLQKIKTTLLRQMLDNLYLTNYPELEVELNNANMDDAQTRKPGGLKRVKRIGAYKTLDVPFTAAASAPMLDQLDAMKESRTGVSRHTLGLDADALAQSTKGAFMGALNQASQRIELIARIFAETGFKALFRKAHAAIRKYQDVPRTIKLRNEWIDVDPTNWRERTDMTVMVGTGNATSDELLAKLVQMAERQGEMLAAGSSLVTEKNLYNTLDMIVSKAGLKNVDKFFTNPDTVAPTEEGPSLEQQVISMQAEIEQMKGMIKMRELEIKEREQARKEAETRVNAGLKAAQIELDNAVDIAKIGVTGTGYPEVTYEQI